jgi:hypothetical protein
LSPQRTLLVIVIAIAGATCVWLSSLTRAPTPPPAAPPPSAQAATVLINPAREEPVDSPAECEDVCGSDCDRGRLRCPRRCERDDDCTDGTVCLVSRLDAAGERVRRCLASGAGSGTVPLSPISAPRAAPSLAQPLR